MKPLKPILLAASVLPLALSTAHADQFVRMVSGPSGGSWYPLGAKIMQVMDDEIDGITTSNTSGGGISNVLSVNGGDAEFGFTYAHTAANGRNARGKFNKAQKDVRHFATLYGSMFQVAVRKDSPIKSFDDMKGANISPGKAKWTGTAFAEAILKEYGITFDSIRKNGGTVHHVSYTESVALMKDGHIDVFMGATNMPQASFLELEQSPGVRFIGIEDDAKYKKILNDNPGFVPGVMPKGVYKSLGRDLKTLGITVAAIVHKDLPDDLVYKMCKVFWASHAKFVEVKSVWKRVKQENALAGVAIPIHPGAQKCYDELGVKKS